MTRVHKRLGAGITLVLLLLACDEESTVLPPPPEQPSLENRFNCDEIKGTVYQSEAERAWFLANCLSGAQGPPISCHSSYPDVCLLTNVGDYDCEGLGENGPNYARGPFRITGPDEFLLDRDGDRIACE
jgi:hypothetical protein